MIHIVDPIFRTQTRRSDRPSRVKEMCGLLRDIFFIREVLGAGDRRDGDDRRGGRISTRDSNTSLTGERDVFNRGDLTAVRGLSFAMLL